LFGCLVRDGVLAANPVARVVKPRGRKQGASAAVTAEQHARLLAATFHPAARTVRVAAHKTDREGHDRTLSLDEATAEAVAELCRLWPAGPVFRTYKGTVWMGRAITEAFRNTRAKAGVTAICYGYRHAFGTEALASGIPDAHVAAMMGHSTTATLHAQYSHVMAKCRQLADHAEELARKRAGSPSSPLQGS
jgi:integrase